MSDEASHRELANTWARTAGEGFADGARYLRSVPEDEWEGPSGCADWTIRHLAGHIAGEAAWFPNLVRGVTRGEEPYPRNLYKEMMSWEPPRLTERIAQGAGEVVQAVGEATEKQLEAPVDMGFARLPMWRATYVSALEGVLHGWDTKAEREQNPTLPHAWALRMAGPLTDFATGIAHHSQIATAPGVYLLDVEEFGPVTVTAQGNSLSVKRGAHGTPRVTLSLTPDQYVRLITGRLDVERSHVPIEGDQERVTGLTRIFGGIANGD